MVRDMLDEFWQTDTTQDQDLFLFDRGFFSRHLARKVGSRAKFVFRVKSNCLGVIDRANLPDQTVICKEQGEADLVLRVINYVLPTGEVERLVTNVFDGVFDVGVFGALYELRWGVETCFRSLKSRLEIEDFSSAKLELILQDFFASVYVYNLVVAALEEAERQKSAPKSERKYVYACNGHVALSEVRSLLIDCFSVDDLEVRKMLFRCAMDCIVRHEEPVCPGRFYVRKVKHKSAKYHLNTKSAL